MRPRVWLLLPGVAVLPLMRAAERDLERTFPVRPGCTLKVDTYRGSITVVESDAPRIVVAVHLEIGADSEEQADRLLAALQLDFAAADNTVAVRARNPRETGLKFVWSEKYEIDPTFKVSVPRQCSVALVTRAGNITVGNLAGRHSARTEAGAIFFRRIDGSIDARADAGDVVVSRCSGPVTAHVGVGTIRTGTLGGPGDLQTGQGLIEVLAARAGLVAESAAGGVTAGFPKDFRGESRLTTAASDINVRLAPTADCTIVASTVWGHVESALPLTIESGGLGRSKLTARLNAGGPRLVLHANGGHVKITALDSGLD